MSLGYPEASEEREILRRFREADPLSDLSPVASGEALSALTSVCLRARYSAEAPSVEEARTAERALADLTRLSTGAPAGEGR